MTQIGGEFPDPFAQHVLMQIEITGCLRNRNAPTLHQPYCLKLELATVCCTRRRASADPDAYYDAQHLAARARASQSGRRVRASGQGGGGGEIAVVQAIVDDEMRRGTAVHKQDD